MIPFLSLTPVAATPSSDVGEGGNSSNVGAIVGGVVGALLCALVIAAVVITIWCFIRNRRRNEHIYDYVGLPTVPPRRRNEHIYDYVGLPMVPPRRTTPSPKKPQATHADVATRQTDTLYPTPTQMDMENDGYSNRVPAATPFTMSGENNRKGLEPSISMGTNTAAPDVGHTSTSIQMQSDGLYSDPRYYGEDRKPEGSSGTIAKENSSKGQEPSRSMGTN